ncbi:MAG: hypothetical protein HY659_12230 [Rhizobiales bacterium]|nr:hypothetical protein [Hyphomicrobiales bacterium]
MLIAIVVTAGMIMNAAFALAGATISDKRYWPNEARGNPPDTAIVLSRKAPTAAVAPQVSSDQNRGRSQKFCRARNLDDSKLSHNAC